jgi:succinate dehydrogenase / fumarate reductase cytochrome b subunit
MAAVLLPSPHVVPGGGRRRPLTESFMSTRPGFFTSSVGTKILIALTGLALFGFLIVHLAGNLLILVGPAAFNEYSHKLLSNPLIYVAEAGLAAIFVLHVFKTLTNWAANRAARPRRYVRKEWAGHTSRKTWASTTMILSGTITFVFVLLHLKTFKFGPNYETVSPSGTVRDLYRLTFEVFSNPVSVVFYVLCMALIFMHLRHGIASAIQSLGINHPRFDRLIVRAGLVLAIAIAGGFAIIPVYVFLVGGRS